MDETLRALARRFAAHPHDAAVRRAYAQALARAGSGLDQALFEQVPGHRLVQLLSSYEGESRWVGAGAFDLPRGRLYLAGGDGLDSVCAWRVPDMVRDWSFQPERIPEVHALAVSPDGERVAALCPRALVCWDTTGAQLASRELPEEARLWSSDAGLIWLDGGRLVSWGHMHGSVCVWDADLELVTRLQHPAEDPSNSGADTAALAPDGRLVTLHPLAGELCVWDSRSWTLQTTVGGRLTSESEGLDPEDDEPLDPDEDEPIAPVLLAAPPTGGEVLVLYEDNWLERLPLDGGPATGGFFTVETHPDYPPDALWCVDARWAFVDHRSTNTVRRIDTREQRVETVLRLDMGASRVVFAADGSRVWTSWGLHAGNDLEVVAEPRDHLGPVVAVSAPTPEVVLSLSVEAGPMRWRLGADGYDYDDPSVIDEAPAPANPEEALARAIFGGSPDGVPADVRGASDPTRGLISACGRLAVRTAGGVAQLYALGDEQLRQAPPDARLGDRACAVRADGVFAECVPQHAFRLRDLRGGEATALCELALPDTLWFNALAFSADGRSLAGVGPSHLIVYDVVESNGRVELGERWRYRVGPDLGPDAEPPRFRLPASAVAVADGGGAAAFAQEGRLARVDARAGSPQAVEVGCAGAQPTQLRFVDGGVAVVDPGGRHVRPLDDWSQRTDVFALDLAPLADRVTSAWADPDGRLVVGTELGAVAVYARS